MQEMIRLFFHFARVAVSKTLLVMCNKISSADIYWFQVCRHLGYYRLTRFPSRVGEAGHPHERWAAIYNELYMNKDDTRNYYRSKEQTTTKYVGIIYEGGLAGRPMFSRNKRKLPIYLWTPN